MHRRSAILVIAVGIGVPTPGARAGELEAVRSSTEQWMQTRQLISRTKADWRADREILEQTRQMFDRELNSLADQFSKLSTNNVQVTKERQEAEALLKSSDEAAETARRFAADAEKSVNRLVPRLPVPLQETLKPFLARIPSDPANTRASSAERIQVLVGILNEIDKFNNALTLFSEKRRTESGEEVAVETVYVGLGAAYFVNETGNFAGLGSPGATGWEWTIRPELASSVREVIRIYRNERPARFVSLPASIR